ncbi:Uncharacterized protein Fot_26246 [Forsythia ovata]|uniref:Uncharacterized protein n=1 Tax=Forsythia ovata TaxID=205694 RepID=A0ABD1UC32_9LAMI
MTLQGVLRVREYRLVWRCQRGGSDGFSLFLPRGGMPLVLASLLDVEKLWGSGRLYRKTWTTGVLRWIMIYCTTDRMMLPIGCRGIMLTMPNNLVYEYGEIDYIDYVHSSILNRHFLDKLVEGVGLDMLMGFLYKEQKLSLLEGMVRIHSNIDIAMLLKDRNGTTEVDIYLVPPTPTHK